MVTKCFAAVTANVSSCFLSTAYVSPISNNVLLTSLAIEITVFIRTGNVSELWFWTSFSHEYRIYNY